MKENDIILRASSYRHFGYPLCVWIIDHFMIVWAFSLLWIVYRDYLGCLAILGYCNSNRIVVGTRRFGCCSIFVRVWFLLSVWTFRIIYAPVFTYIDFVYILDVAYLSFLGVFAVFASLPIRFDPASPQSSSLVITTHPITKPQDATKD